MSAHPPVSLSTHFAHNSVPLAHVHVYIDALLYGYHLTGTTPTSNLFGGEELASGPVAPEDGVPTPNKYRACNYR